jgi:hypothetical protein
MKNNLLFKLTLSVIYGLILLPLTTSAQQETEWLNTGSGLWSEASNWGSGIPTEDYYAEFWNGGTAVINNGSMSCGTLLLGDSFWGSLDGLSGNLTVNGNGYLNVSYVSVYGYDTDHKSILNIAGSGSVNAGNITLSTNSFVNISENGRLMISYELSIYEGGALNISGGGYLGGAGTVFGGSGVVMSNGGILATTLTFRSGLTLGTGVILDYAGSGLLVNGGTITVSDGIVIDFSGVALTDGQSYTIIDYANALGSVDANQFSAVGTDVEGGFAVQNGQLVFTTGAIPEPSTYFLLGAGLGALLLAARCRRRKAQS